MSSRKSQVRKWLQWLFGLTLMGALLAQYWPERDDKKDVAITAGSNSTIIQSSHPSVTVNASPGAIVPVIQDSPNASQSITVHQGPKKRTISPEQAEIMKSILGRVRGSRLTIVFKMNDSECEQFSTQLEKVFADAGWNVDRIATMSTGGPHLSIWLRVSSNDVREVRGATASQTDGQVPMYVPGRIYMVASALKEGLGMNCEMIPDSQLKSGEMDLRIEKAD